MSRTAKAAVVLIAFLASGIALAATTAAVVTYRSGTMMVSVHEKTPDGVSFSVGVPLILVRAGIYFVPSDKLQVARESAGPFLAMICRAAEALAEAPDGTLVEVENDRETVRVAMEGGNLTIAVDSPCEAITVSVPVRAVAGIARFLRGPAGTNNTEAEARSGRPRTNPAVRNDA